MSGIPVKVHGGVQFLGPDPGVQNFQLEELSADPVAPGVGRMWLNTTEKVAKYVYRLNGDGEPMIAVFANTSDLLAVQQALANKADKGTTLSDYGIIDAVSAFEIVELKEAFDDANIPSGFVSRSDTILSFDNATRTLTITPAAAAGQYRFYVDGVKFIKTLPDSIQISDQSGLWFIYYNSDGILTASQTPWDVMHTAQVAVVYWNSASASLQFMGDERHMTIMDPATHAYLHATEGTRYRTGLAIGNYNTLGLGTADADVQFSLTNGSIQDEDIVINIQHGDPALIDFGQTLTPIAQIPVMWRSGNNWFKDAPTAFPLKAQTRMLFNNYDSALEQWVASDAAEGAYVAMFIVATNAFSHPVVAVMGQRQDATLDDAKELNDFAILNWGNLPFSEFKILYRLIFQTSDTYTNTVKARLLSVDDLRAVSRVAVSAVTSANHETLLGLGADDHPQYVLANGARPLTGPMNAGNYPLNNVNAINGVDVTTFGDINAGAGFVQRNADGEWSARNILKTDLPALELSDLANLPTTVEGYGIANAVKDDDFRIQNIQIKVVSKQPGSGQYATIGEAIASITDAAANKPYLIRVDPGQYIESTLVIKPYTWIDGAAQTSVEIISNNPEEHLIEANVHAGISNVTLTGATGDNKALIHMDHVDGSTTKLFRAESVRFGSGHALVLVNRGYVKVMNCTFGGEGYHFTCGFFVQDNGTQPALITMKNSTTTGMTTPFPTTLLKSDGPNSLIYLFSVVGRASPSTAEGSGVGTGLHLRNGGRVRALGSALLGFEKGIWVENAGVAPTLECVGFDLGSNTMDLVVDHPGVVGNFQGSAQLAKVQVNPQATGLSIFYSDQKGNGMINVGPIYTGKTHSSVADIQPIIGRGMQTGLLEGGVLSAGTGLMVNATAGQGYIKNDGWLKTVKWIATTLPVLADKAQYVYVDGNGVVKTSLALPDANTNVILGRLLTDSAGITMVGTQGSLNIETFHPNLDKLLRLALGVLYVSGSVVSENATTPRAIDVTMGHYFYSTSERKPAARIAPTMMVPHWLNGELVTQYWTQFANTGYTSGTSEVPATAGYYLKHTIYTNGDGENVGFIVAHASAEYATLEDAIAGPNPIPAIAPDGSPLIAAVIVQQGNNHIVEILDLRPRIGNVTGGASAGAVMHGDLLGLEDDNHPQYLLASGLRKMAGPLDMNNNPVLNVTTINDVNISEHGSRHAPNGEDPFPTAAPTAPLTPASQNSAGVANSFARSDHVHEIEGFQPLSSNLTNLAGVSTFGFYTRTTALSAATRVFTGTTKQITVVNGDGIEGNPTFSIATNPVIPGAGGMLVPVGETVDRLSEIGRIRYNVTLDNYEGFGAYGWKPLSAAISQYIFGTIPQASGTSVIPYGNSAPTITQGTQIWSHTITPTSVDATMKIMFNAIADMSNASSYVTVSLFRNSLFIGIAVISSAKQGTDFLNTLSIRIPDQPNTLEPVTYSCRIGASAGTWYLGRSQNATFGGNVKSTWSIEEFV